VAIAGMSEGGDYRADFLVPPLVAPLEVLTVPPRFSIVIPAYQAADTIGQALDSALNQIQPAHEVIVVDDGSTDDLTAALSPYRERIRLIEKDNGGVASARNAGLNTATGEFMAVLDADDRYHPERLQALTALAMQRPDLDLITTDTRFIVDGRPAGTFRESNPFALTRQREAILGSCFVGGWPAVRLTALRGIGGFDESLRQGEDWDCWLRLILSGAAAGLVDRPYYDYVLRAGSLTTDRAASLWARVQMLQKTSESPLLRSSDRAALERSLRRHHSRAVRADVHAVAREGASRRLLARHLFSKRLERKARFLVAVTMISPGPVRRAASAWLD
jgi:glycosyltransferase involved in cell wall biosynthesis